MLQLQVTVSSERGPRRTRWTQGEYGKHESNRWLMERLGRIEKDIVGLAGGRSRPHLYRRPRAGQYWTADHGRGHEKTDTSAVDGTDHWSAVTACGQWMAGVAGQCLLDWGTPIWLLRWPGIQWLSEWLGEWISVWVFGWVSEWVSLGEWVDGGFTPCRHLRKRKWKNNIYFQI